MSAVLAPVPETAPGPEPERYSALRLASGIVGRAWLWFLLGCLLITFVPIVFGWRPYVIESNSMAPRIKAGDVVLSAPVPDATARDLLGHVIVFDDPNIPGRVITHRVVKTESETTMRTKGDANPQQDSQPIATSAVRGMGRLLVRFVGLPFVWLHEGRWAPFALFLLSLGVASWAVSRDRDEDQPDAPDDHDNPPGREPTTGPIAPPAASWQIAATSPFRLPPGAAGVFVRRLATRSAIVFGLSLLLVLPAAGAAFSATSRNAGNTWTVPTYNYTTQAKALGPKIYYKLDDASGANATDSSGNGYTGTYNGTGTNFTYGVAGALVDQSPNLAVTQKNANACVFTAAAASEAAPGPTTYSEIVWFKVASGYSLGGKLVGMENQRTTTVASQYDRHIYMDGNGKLFFGVWLTTPGTPKTINTTASYNDGAWHMAASTMGPAGMRLYVDGVLRASDPNTTSESFGNTGYWRFGCGNLSGWGGAATWTGPNAPSASTNYALQGSLDEVAIYSKELTATDLAFLYFIR